MNNYKNMDEEKVVLQSDASLDFHRLKEEIQKTKNVWDKPRPSCNISSSFNTENSYKRYYEGKNPWVEFG